MFNYIQHYCLVILIGDFYWLTNKTVCRQVTLKIIRSMVWHVDCKFHKVTQSLRSESLWLNIESLRSNILHQ